MAKVRIGLLGCGGFMGCHAKRLLTNSDAAIVALCDVKEELVQKFLDARLKGYEPAPQIFTDAAQMYAQARLDAVFIATPHTLHFEHGIQALEAGCNVFMEKPMVTSLEDAYALAAKAEETEKILVVGYNTSASPQLRYVRDVIRKGTLGKLELVTGCLTQNWLKLTAGTWRRDPALSGGGQAYDSGAHLMNSLCWSVESDVEEAFAFIDNHGTAVDINSTIVVRFANGVMAAIAISGNCPANSGPMSFIFDNGRIDVDGWDAGWIKAWEGDEEIKPTLKGEAQTPDDNFIDAVLGRAEPATTPRNGIIQSQLMDAIYESARTGKPARPPSREES